METENILVTLLKTSDGREVNLTEVLATKPAFVIGTDPRAGLRLLGVGVEPAHAIITRRDADYYVSPRVPSAQVRLNAVLVTQPTRFTAGDMLHFGAEYLNIAQAEAVAPVQLMPATPKSAVIPSSYQGVSHSAAASVPAIATVNIPADHEIYFPQPASSGGRSVPALISGIITVLIVVGVIGYGFITGTPTTAADVTSQYAFQDGHVTVVMFEASWCTFCKVQKPILTSLATDYRGKVYNQFLDAEAPVNKAMVSAFNVSAYPVTVIFNDQGQVTAKFLGLTDVSSIRTAIDLALTESVGQKETAA